jgi:hypothetical protein
MVHLLVVVAVVGGLRLVAMDLDRQAVDVDGDLAQTMATAIARNRRPAISATAFCSTRRLAGWLSISSRRDSVGCEGRCCPWSSAAVPAASEMATRSTGSKRSASASSWSRQPWPYSTSTVRSSSASG